MPGSPTHAIHAIVLHPDDDVAVLTQPAADGQDVLVGGAGPPLALRVKQDLLLGHKIALRAAPSGALIRKYGEAIGVLNAAVEAGDHVHVHNLASRRAH